MQKCPKFLLYDDELNDYAIGKEFWGSTDAQVSINAFAQKIRGFVEELHLNCSKMKITTKYKKSKIYPFPSRAA